MTNIFGAPEKLTIRKMLFQAALQSLEGEGWKIDSERGDLSSKSSVRRIRRGGAVKLVSIRTTQDCWFAFPRNEARDGWATLEDVDAVVISSVDRKGEPRLIKVHMVDAAEITERFDRAMAARKEAGYELKQLESGRGMWVSLYEPEVPVPANRIGGGIGLRHPPIGEYEIADFAVTDRRVDDADLGNIVREDMHGSPEMPLTIGEAKRRLALTLGVPESAISIIING